VPGQRTRRRFARTGDRLTAAGWIYLLVMMVVLAAAVRHDAAVTLMLLGAMFTGLVVSAVLARRMVSKIDVTRQAPDRLWQGQPTHVSYFLSSRHRWLPGLGLVLHDLNGGDVHAVDGYCACLTAHGRFRSGGRLVARRRGQARLTGLEVRTTFPFGLVRAWRRLAIPAEAVVWPARGRLKAPLLRRGAAVTSMEKASLVSGGQDEFIGLRELRDDDNPRLIHWRRSAGRDTPLIREMARPRPDVLFVVLDAPAAEDGSDGANETMLRLAATLIDHAMTRGYQVGLAVADGEVAVAIPPAAGRAQLRALLDALARVDAHRHGSLADVLASLRPSWVHQAEVIVLRHDRPPAANGALRRLRATCSHLTCVSGTAAFKAVFEDNPGLKELLDAPPTDR